MHAIIFVCKLFVTHFVGQVADTNGKIILMKDKCSERVCHSADIVHKAGNLILALYRRCSSI